VTQTGALACAATYPVVNWVRRDRSALRAPEMLRFVGRFAAAGAPLGATMAALRLAGEPDWFVRSCAAAVRADGDRVRRAVDIFREWCSRKMQKRLNVLTLVGASAGAALGALAFAERAGPALTRATGGGAFGGAVGFVMFLGLGGRVDIMNWYGVPPVW
jgi:hypothetical protein